MKIKTKISPFDMVVIVCEGRDNSGNPTLSATGFEYPYFGTGRRPVMCRMQRDYAISGRDEERAEIVQCAVKWLKLLLNKAASGSMGPTPAAASFVFLGCAGEHGPRARQLDRYAVGINLERQHAKA